MHREAYEFVANMRTRVSGRRVLDLGSQDINGSPREQFSNADLYVGVDLVDGPGVDVVADVVGWRTDARFDAVICCEVLEHEANWRSIIATADHHLEPGGHLILTAASAGRPPHSCYAGDHRDEVVPPLPGEHYENIDVGMLWACLRAFPFEVVVLQYRREPGDVYVLARKP